jgi:hypothetical protein
MRMALHWNTSRLLIWEGRYLGRVFLHEKYSRMDIQIDSWDEMISRKLEICKALNDT